MRDEPFARAWALVTTTILDSLLRFQLPAPACPTYDQFWTTAILPRKLNSEAWGMIESRKETTLVEKAIERTETDDVSAPPDEPSTVDVSITRLVSGVDEDATHSRRERRARRVSSATEPVDFDARRARRARRASAAAEPLGSEPAPPDVISSDGATTATEVQQTDREAPRATSGERRRRPRAPRAEKIAAVDSTTAIDEDDSAGESTGLPADSDITAEALAVDVPGKKSSHTLRRAQRKRQEATAALGDASDNPALGALNRHLNMLTQQLGTAHRVIGRVAAERDALRQQLADLQGIPVEEIVVTSIGAATEKDERPAKTRESDEPQPQTGIARFNYFRHEDIDVMRKRRQILALVLVGVVLVLWFLGRMGMFQLPENLGKDSLANLPFIGEIMSYFLAGWVFYRVIRIGGRGVKWVFPSDQKRKRR
jgi:hypothetical protein